MMSVGAEVLCRIAGRLAEEYGVGRRDIRAAGAAATRAAG
jgi:hypothetical protein